MIIITGASGTLGSEVVRQLELTKEPFRAGYFSAEQAKDARARAINAAIIDYSKPGSLSGV